MIGDVQICVVPPDYLKRLCGAAEKYDDALRLAGIKRAALADDRNEADGKVYEARKQFLAVVAEANGV